MRNEQHTPGPWQEIPSLSGSLIVGRSKTQGSDVCAIRRHGDLEPTAEDVANAQLIAAAPDLYAVARGLLALVDASPRAYQYDGPLLEVVRQARTVVAKAEGQGRNP